MLDKLFIIGLTPLRYWNTPVLAHHRGSLSLHIFYTLFRMLEIVCRFSLSELVIYKRHMNSWEIHIFCKLLQHLSHFINFNNNLIYVHNKEKNRKN